MSDAKALDRATKARAVLDSLAYQEAYTTVRQKLVDALFAVKYEDKDEAEDFRRCVKLLDALKGELDQMVIAGKVAEANLDELEKRRKNPLRGIFR